MVATYGPTGLLVPFTIQNTGTYHITAFGALGGGGGGGVSGGKGAKIEGDFLLHVGAQLDIVVGEQGGSGVGGAGGGGGGSFVIETNDGYGPVHLALLIAGGGGGGSYFTGVNSQVGYGASASAGANGGGGGTFGGGGQAGGGGVSFAGSAGGGFASGGGGIGGGQGADGNFSGGLSSYFGTGGFGGGGGGGHSGGGGGGGYNGGGGGYGALSFGFGGGGGGSFDGGYNPVIVGENAGGGSVTLELLCYLRGTHILTPTGETFVENLKIGDLVVTRFGGIQPIKWIGRQSYDSRFVQTEWDHIPVRLHAGALGQRLPARDLYISPGHSMLLDGQLVMASSLVNGVTVTQDSSPSQIDYFQIELEAHDCVIAEGTWSETYADAPGLREQFHNAAEFAALYPDHAPPDELSLCAPRPERGAKLDAVLRPVVALASSSLTPGPLRGHIDRVAAPWTIEGWANDADHPELPVLLEVLLEDTVIGTVLACDYRPDLAKAGLGHGRCAFFLTSPVRLRPELIPSLRIRRASDHARIVITPACAAATAAPRQPSPAPVLRLVA